MSEVAPPPQSAASLLDELDARQNEVLDQLSALDAQITATLKEWTGDRGDVAVKEAA